jgi:hypothetical protein
MSTFSVFRLLLYPPRFFVGFNCESRRLLLICTDDVVLDMYMYGVHRLSSGYGKPKRETLNEAKKLRRLKKRSLFVIISLVRDGEDGSSPNGSTV